MLAAPAAIWHLDEHVAWYLECGAELWDENTTKVCSGNTCRDLCTWLFPGALALDTSSVLLGATAPSFGEIFLLVSLFFLLSLPFSGVWICFSSSGRLEYAKQGLISEWEEGPEE